MKLFIGAGLPHDTIDHLITLQQALKVAPFLQGYPVSWTRAEKFHITLAFLGEQSNKQVPRIIDTIKQVAHGKEPIHAHGEALEYHKHAHVFWLRVISPELDIVAHKLHAALDDLMPNRSREYRAHITLARIPEQVKELHIDNPSNQLGMIPCLAQPISFYISLVKLTQSLNGTYTDLYVYHLKELER